MGFIYKITNKKNGKVYIGQTKRNIRERWCCHVSDSKKRDSTICRAIRKYGRNNFKIEKIDECKNEELNDKELFHINNNESLTPKGYNILKGNISNGLSEDWLNSDKFKNGRRKQAEKMRGRKNTPEHNKNISISRTNNPKVIAANKKNSKIFSEKYKGKIVNPEGWKKLQEVWKDTERAKEIRKRINISLKETWKTKDKSNAKARGEKRWGHKRKKYLVTSPEEKIFMVLGLNKHCKKYNLDTSAMSKVARNIQGYNKHKNWRITEI